MENKVTIYRKYRPNDFNSIAGHKNIVEILKKQLENNKVAQSFLFAGQRGTGKTSIARILAKSVNCPNLTNGVCCEQCKNCLISNNQQNSDIIEMDAASNNGVDEIREIKNSVSTLPIGGKYKIYIIDEVHMLTKSAFNALLKTLEEPPKHAIFILATTEYAKIPSTIISRCQVFNFKKIDKNSIKQRLNFIVKQEGFEIENEAASEIATLCDGSLRDACNMLEQLFNITTNTITINDLKSIFYIASKNEKLILIKNILENKPEKIITYFETADSQGMDFDVFTLSLIEIIKEIIEFRFLNSKETLSILDEDELKDFKDVNLSKLFEITDNLSDAYAKTKGTNINFNYLLINVLRSLSTIKPTNQFDASNTNFIKHEETKNPINIDSTPTLTPTQSMETNNLIDVIDKENHEKVELKTTQKEPIDIHNQNVEKVEAIETICETPTLLKYEIEKEILDIENKKPYNVEIKEVINLLIGANKKMREDDEVKLAQIFEKDDYNQFVNINLANKMKPFFGFQVIASSMHEILIRHPNYKNVKFLLVSLLQKPFLDQVKDVFNNKVIIPVSEMLWEDVKIEYKKNKDNNSLPIYLKNDFDSYYDAKKQSIIKNLVDEETLDAVAQIFDLNSVEIEE